MKKAITKMTELLRFQPGTEDREDGASCAKDADDEVRETGFWAPYKNELGEFEEVHWSQELSYKGWHKVHRIWGGPWEGHDQDQTFLYKGEVREGCGQQQPDPFMHGIKKEWAGRSVSGKAQWEARPRVKQRELEKESSAKFKSLMSDLYAPPHTVNPRLPPKASMTRIFEQRDAHGGGSSSASEEEQTRKKMRTNGHAQALGPRKVVRLTARAGVQEKAVSRKGNRPSISLISNAEAKRKRTDEPSLTAGGSNPKSKKLTKIMPQPMAQRRAAW